MIVVDASAVVEWLSQSRRGQEVANRIRRHQGSLHAPDLLFVEVASALRRMRDGGLIDRPRANSSFDAARALRVELHASEPYLSRMWALQSAMSCYDAMYVALGEVLGAPLLTCDARLARAHGHAAGIELVH